MLRHLTSRRSGGGGGGTGSIPVFKAAAVAEALLLRRREAVKGLRVKGFTQSGLEASLSQTLAEARMGSVEQCSERHFSQASTHMT